MPNLLVTLGLGALQWPVGRSVRQKREERLRPVLFRPTLKILDEIIRVVVRRVKAFGILSLIGRPSERMVSATSPVDRTIFAMHLTCPL